MKIHYFANTTNPNAAGTRYRGTYLLAEIKKTFNINYSIYHPDIISFLKISFLIFKNSITGDKENVYIIQKVSAPGKYFQFLSSLIKRVEKSFYDIDDAMYDIRDKKTVDYFIKNCHGVVAASQNLLNYCQKINHNSILITTPVPDQNTKKNQKNKTGFTLGWIGFYTTVHIESLEKIFFPMLKEIKLPIQLMILGVYRDTDEENLRNIFKKEKNITLKIIREINWNDENEINSYISQFDVGIMPLINNEINRSKSAFKIKQYLVNGVPALASDVGDNKLFIRNGINGFLCQDKNDWIKYINYFYNLDAKSYLEFTKKSREGFLKGDFNLERAAEKFYQFILEDNLNL